MIGYYAHHQGAGHVTRLQSVAACLQEPVWGLSSLPRPAAWSGPWTVLERDDGTAEGAPQDVTAGGVLHWAPVGHAGLSRRMTQLAAWVAGHRPRLVVVDVSVEVALFIRLMGIPTVVVALPGRRLDPPHRLAYDSAAALLAPWPEGAHGQDWPTAWTEKTWHVGGISRFDGRAPAPRPGSSGSRRRVLVLWGSGGRSVDAAAVAGAAASTPGWDWSERDPVRAPAVDLWADLAAADVVVTHGGQNAVAEVAAARRPAVVVAQPRPFGEQEATVGALDRLGIAVGLQQWPAPERWPAVLERAAGLGGDGWGRWSSGEGARRAAEHLSRLDRIPQDLSA
ncbi:glycosyltransferase [Ornithinimicrobium avium]|uniref:Glycosyl transferase family 28 C-terminal domain-containing protein n=1 Tax=Ornithinimicrobium avium TaxID=2283195 RepID=A0A345NQV8_9MICO|nr:glycosyltransferase [Ornithinimicrobium avium]AXH97416.1 hypothetical protein DV701_16030 [Ornithinimicrobium avium]